MSTDSGGLPSVTCRALSGPTELAAASELIGEVFGAPAESMPVDLLTAVGCANGFVGGAFSDGELVGVAMGFGEVTPSGEPPALHSHIAAVRRSARGLRVGQQLKWFQREWAMQRGIAVIHWTFDPLVRRNAVLNLNRLGAVASTYYDDLYGAIPDELNAGMESDRLLVRWELDSHRVQAAHAGIASSAGQVIATIDTPPDLEMLVRQDVSSARQWRESQRRAFHALPDGWLVTGIDDQGRYQVEQKVESE